MLRLTVLSVPILRKNDQKIIAHLSIYGMTAGEYFEHGQAYIDAVLRKRGLHDDHYAVMGDGKNVTARVAPSPYFKPKIEPIPKISHDELYSRYVSTTYKRAHGI